MASDIPSETRAARFKLLNWGHRSVRAIGGAFVYIFSHHITSYVFSLGRWKGKGGAHVPAWYIYYLIIASAMMGFSLWWEWSKPLSMGTPSHAHKGMYTADEVLWNKMGEIDYSGDVQRLQRVRELGFPACGGAGPLELPWIRPKQQATSPVAATASYVAWRAMSIRLSIKSYRHSTNNNMTSTPAPPPSPYILLFTHPATSSGSKPFQHRIGWTSGSADARGRADARDWDIQKLGHSGASPSPTKARGKQQAGGAGVGCDKEAGVRGECEDRVGG
eukprot:474747-Pyramimonas_sp.AAC.1